MSWSSWLRVAPSPRTTRHYPDLTLAQVHAALTCYYDRTNEIEAELAAEDQAAEDFERRKAELLASQLPDRPHQAKALSPLPETP